MGQSSIEEEEQEEEMLEDWKDRQVARSGSMINLYDLFLWSYCSYI
jgi:hypothetical protein